MRRRQALFGMTAVLTGIAGCFSRPVSEQQGVSLAGIELGNATDESQIFNLLVTYEEEIVHWEAHEVEPGSETDMGSKVVDPGITTGPGDVGLKCRVGEHATMTDFDDPNFHGECVLGTFLYGFRDDQVLSSHPTTVDFQLPDSITCPSNE